MIVTYTGPNAEHLIVNLDFVEIVVVDRGTTILHMNSGLDVTVVADAEQILLDLRGNAEAKSGFNSE